VLRGFFNWLERRSYQAVFSGCRKAVYDLSAGEVVVEADTPLLADEVETVEALPEPAKKPVKKKRATRT